MGMFLRRGPAPKLRTIGTLDVGSIVKLNESGSPVEFYVAKHDYEPDLNGSGRTLLVRKDCYDMRQWNSSRVNAYASSAIDSWLNGTYKGPLDAEIQTAMGLTAFKYTPGDGDTSVGTLQRSIFLLSFAELGETSATWYNIEGSALDIADALRIAYIDGSAANWWVRSPRTNTTTHAGRFSDRGSSSNYYCDGSNGSRPVFTLPSSFKVTDDMLA